MNNTFYPLIGDFIRVQDRVYRVNWDWELDLIAPQCTPPEGLPSVSWSGLGNERGFAGRGQGAGQEHNEKETEMTISNAKRHPHAELIHAWAEGAEIELMTIGRGWMAIQDPTWEAHWEYRIKPPREFPQTSLTAAQLAQVYYENLTSDKVADECLPAVANAAIRQYILDREAQTLADNTSGML